MTQFAGAYQGWSRAARGHGRYGSLEKQCFLRVTVFPTCYSVSWEEADHAWKKYMHKQKQAVEIQAVIGEAMNGQVGKKPTEKKYKKGMVNQ